MSQYRKKPIVIEAFLWTGTREQAEDPEWIVAAINAGHIKIHYPNMMISTLEGTMTASAGDYIIRGVQGEIYPCKPDIFDATYEPVQEARCNFDPAGKLCECQSALGHMPEGCHYYVPHE